MIPKIIHYCWFGRTEIPELAQNCIHSWHKHMPDWEFVLWNEENFAISTAPAYVREAYTAKKYAFVSDYVRLFALKQYGGVYLDVDFEVYKSFFPLLNNSAFAGYEGSKRSPIMMGVLASEPNGEWVTEALKQYDNRHFLLDNVKYDMTPNTSFFTNWMVEQGLVLDGKEKTFKGLHIYPVDYFCPTQTTGEYLRSENTFCEHRDLRTWNIHSGWKYHLIKWVVTHLGPQWKVRIIKTKRRLFG